MAFELQHLHNERAKIACKKVRPLFINQETAICDFSIARQVVFSIQVLPVNYYSFSNF